MLNWQNDISFVFLEVDGWVEVETNNQNKSAHPEKCVEIVFSGSTDKI